MQLSNWIRNFLLRMEWDYVATDRESYERSLV